MKEEECQRLIDKAWKTEWTCSEDLTITGIIDSIMMKSESF